MMTRPVNLLHLSDLHFGMEPTQKTPSIAVDQRNLTLRTLIKTLKMLPQQWRPQVVAVTGDIGWKGGAEDYRKAKEWLQNELLAALDLPPRKLIICPGNHDLDRDETIGMLPPPSAEEADQWLRLECLKRFSEPFAAYSGFCEELGLLPLEIGDQQSRLSGKVDLEEENLRLIVLNSAWFCRGDADRDKLWLGKPLLDKLAANQQLMDPDDYDDPATTLTIALFHHPPGWLNEREAHAYDHRPSTLAYLSKRAHLILTGHVHARPAQPHQLFNRAWLVNGGASYAGSQYLNHFSILRLDSEQGVFNRLACEFDPGLDRWRADDNAFTYNLRTSARRAPAFSAPPLTVPGQYREWVLDWCGCMDVDHLQAKGSPITIRLPDVFIPLYTLSEKAVKEGDGAGHDPEMLLKSGDHTMEVEDLISDGRDLLIEGEAGCGKTTLLKHFVYMSLTRPGGKELADHLPVLIFLKDLQDFNWRNAPCNAATAEALLAHGFEKSGCGLDVETVRGYCIAKKVVFLLDGLDEVEKGLRDLVANALAGYRRRCKGGWFVFSGRPHGVAGDVVKRFGRRRVKILSLTMGQVETFIHKWFEGVAHSTGGRVSKTAEGMISEIKVNAGVEKLIYNPLMLTAVCILYHDRKKLPDQRAELYKKFVQNMLHRGNRFEDPKRIHAYLQSLAHSNHTRRRKGCDQQTALELLRKIYPRQDREEVEYKLLIQQIFERIEPHCGLLKFEAGQLVFRHLTLQEYLTAEYIEDNETRYDEAIRDFWEDEWYREVVELLVGLLSMRNRKWAVDVVTGALEQPDQPPFYRRRLAARSILDIHADRREIEVVDLAAEKLRAVMGSTAKVKERADAGEILGWLGDRRDLTAFIRIPDGEYDTSKGKVILEGFELAKYPVSNQWYNRFIAAGGYENSAYWSKEGLKWREHTRAAHPWQWHDRPWNCPNHPVVGVCWWEAAAFCRWLSEFKHDGYAYALPTEQQWEAAAGGFDQREFPWGKGFDKNRCNVKETDIGRTCAVGIFAGGETPQGVADLTGNVFEWTISDYHHQKDRDDFPFEMDVQQLFEKINSTSGDEQEKLFKDYNKFYKDKKRQFPVLRGGSWLGFGDWARCAARYFLHPNSRNNSVGFRCSRTQI